MMGTWEGLILLTDDGDLAFRLTHPRFQVRKRYRVELDRPIFSGDLARLRQGLLLEDGPFRPLEVRKLADRVVELSLHEGRKREIRRGFSALGYRVKRLVRLAIGPVELGALRPGELAPLSNTELRALGLEERAKPRSGNRPETD